MYMLSTSGLYTPTDGTAIIQGFDIRTDMEQIRKTMGICPQQNILFDRLTVKEHLQLFKVTMLLLWFYCANKTQAIQHIMGIA